MLLAARKGEVDSLSSPVVEMLGIDEAKTANAVTSPSLQFTSESKTKYDMPLSLIIGQDTIKTALILLAVNPSIGGIVIAGGKGTGKSAMARAIHRVMPPIERIKGSEYNIAPDAREADVDDFLKEKLMDDDGNMKPLSTLETEIITCPFVQVPVNVMEDR
jgi:Mg-chelatase subunit ChlI